MTEAERSALMALAGELADAAGTAALHHFRTADLGADSKLSDAFDPVTAADREAEDAMRAILRQQRPNDAVLGEEMGHQPGSSGLTWVLDPVDGTRGFLAGTPTWGVLVAVSDATGPLYGIIDQPYIGERFMGGFGTARMRGPRGETKLATRPARPLAEAILLTTYPELGTAEETRAFHNVAARARLTRYGMDCYAYALIAAGQIDLVIEADLQPHDIHAPIAVIEAAGGIVTDWRGGPARNGGRVIAAANRAVHAEALDLLAPAGD
ncbi:histidinol-phosphatase [Rhodobacteraceae bacterium WD3A24]|nr:histidinol-phosphatase [Rhodobacteraceae bacterium WD3A24]